MSNFSKMSVFNKFLIFLKMSNFSFGLTKLYCISFTCLMYHTALQMAHNYLYAQTFLQPQHKEKTYLTRQILKNHNQNIINRSENLRIQNKKQPPHNPKHLHIIQPDPVALEHGQKHVHHTLGPPQPLFGVISAKLAVLHYQNQQFNDFFVFRKSQEHREHDLARRFQFLEIRGVGFVSHEKYVFHDRF